MASYERFDRIHKSDKRGLAIEDKYDNLSGKFVVWLKDRVGNSCIPEYRVYDSIADFRKDPADMFHEVITGAQKLKFDIDMKASPTDFVHCNLDMPATIVPWSKSIEMIDFSVIVNYFIDIIREQFYYTYELDLKDEDFVITDSSRVGVKYSAHIIINNYAVSCNKQAGEFANNVVKIAYKQYREILDNAVYKQIQNFRIVGCHNGDGRYKTIVSGHEFEDAIITNISNCKMLPDIIDATYDDTKRVIVPPSNDDIATAVAMCVGATTGHIFRKYHNGMLVYDRSIPTHCEICEEIHHNDNSMIISLLPNTKTVKLIMYCRQAVRGHTGIVIDEFAPLNSAMLIDKSQNWNSNLIARVIEKGTTVKRNDRELLQILNKNTYCDRLIAEFEVAKTLIVRAAMKMGKTKALKTYLDKNYGAGIKSPVIRIVSFRQTFSNNIKEKFPNFTLYSDVGGDLAQDRLIIQIESLHRLKIIAGGDAPDLLILDECESIFEQFNSGLAKNANCFSKFKYLLEHSKRVILMDALVSDRTVNIINSIRADPQIFLHDNQYKNATDDTYNITHDYDMWLREVFTALDEGQKIAMPISSLKIATEVYRMIADKYPLLRVKLYSSETVASEKKLHFADVNYYWAQYDVILYTPTISAGVSFEERHFNAVFAYFTDKSCPVETCVQMLGRVRDVASKGYYICLSATGNSFPCEYDDIKAEIANQRSSLYTNTTINSAIMTEYDASGAVIIHKTAFYRVWIENIRMINISRNYFISKFIDTLTGFGSNIAQFGATIEDGMEAEILEVNELKTTARNSIKSELATRIVEAEEASAEEIADIRNIMDEQKDLTVEQQDKYDKYILRTDYAHTDEITAKFVDTYYDKSKRRLHKNIKKIYSAETHPDALSELQREERAYNRYYMENGMEQSDLSRNYVYAKHKNAYDLLRGLGWRDYADTAQIAEQTLVDNIYTAKFGVIVEESARLFSLKEPYRNTKLLTQINASIIASANAKFVSKILSQMYGITLKLVKGDVDNYKLARSRIFRYEFGLANQLK
jgi:hypothetical protein